MFLFGGGFLWLDGVLLGTSAFELLAFPGASHRVYNEIETEFSKYALRMLENAASSLQEFCLAILSTTTPTPTQHPKGDRTYSVYDIPSLYKRANQYQNKLLGMIHDVLVCLLHHDGFGTENAIAVSNDDNTEEEEVLNQHKNNTLKGDVGDLSSITNDAKGNGKELTKHLQSTLDKLKKVLQSGQSTLFLNVSEQMSLKQMKGRKANEETVASALELYESCSELKEFISSLKSSSSSSSTSEEEEDDYTFRDNEEEEEDDVNIDTVRRKLQQEGGSGLTIIKTAVQTILPLLDPPPHDSIFGFDVMRGCMLSRYVGAKQLWVKNENGGGAVDVLYIPATHRAKSSSSSSGGNHKIEKAVLYCNPNAGLAEIATGMSFMGGNTSSYRASSSSSSSLQRPNSGSSSDDSSSSFSEPNCWTDYYIEEGYDVFLFNYSGYGRSFGNDFGSRVFSCCGFNSSAQKRSNGGVYKDGCMARIQRIFYSLFFGFKPTSESIKNDAVIVAKHIVNAIGVEHLVIHGESIGGMAAACAAKELCISTSGGTTTSCPTALSGGGGGELDEQRKKQPSLLFCDRTFCNLEAVAQRLVGSWTGNAIRLLTPLWNMDVAGDFLASNCAKIVANDAADSIIANTSSLKSGLSFAYEMKKGNSKGVGWILDAPLEYRMADWENVGVNDSKFVKSRSCHTQAPIWPADKHISPEEAFCFAACARRIGKLATTAKRNGVRRSHDSISSGADMDEEEGIEITAVEEGNGVSTISARSSLSMMQRIDQTGLIQMEAWNLLACCDGLCGSVLGTAVKDGFDSTVSWLCDLVTFGGQIVSNAAEKRLLQERKNDAPDVNVTDSGISVISSDFDLRPSDYAEDDDSEGVYPIPIPEVTEKLKRILDRLDEITSKFRMLNKKIHQPFDASTHSMSLLVHLPLLFIYPAVLKAMEPLIRKLKLNIALACLIISSHGFRQRHTFLVLRKADSLVMSKMELRLALS